MEVVDAPLDYNILLGRNWFYVMNVVASSIFFLVQFPHQGKVITLDQLNVFSHDVNTNSANNVPLLGNFVPQYKNIEVGFLKDSSLMGVFPLTTPTPPSQISMINMVSIINKSPSKGKSIEDT